MRSINMLESWLKDHGFTSKRIQLGQPKSSGFLLISEPKSGTELLFSAKRISFPPTTSATRDVTSDKTKTYDLAEQLGVTYPNYMVVNTHDFDTAAVDSFLTQHTRVVVKPHDGLQSRFVTINITDPASLHSAIREAGKLNGTAIIQKQVEGQEIRIVVADKKVTAVLLRQKPQVVGDGTSTISELIEAENQARTSIKGSVVSYPQLAGPLLPDTLDLGKIPDQGAVIEISKATMIKTGASVYRIDDAVDTSYKEIAERICAPLIAPLVCVDIMAHDYTQPATESNYGLIELNLGMSLPLCYSCRDGKHYDIIEEFIGPKVLAAFGLR